MITIKTGAGLSVQRPAHLYPTASSILADRNLQAELGFSASASEVHINGASGATHVQSGDLVTIVPRANSKA